MKIAVLSDIHANIQALEAVVYHARHIDPAIRFWFLGDFVGRGPEPFSVWEKLKNLQPSVWLLGNWDQAMVDPRRKLQIDEKYYTEFKDVYWKALIKQKEYLKSDNKFDGIAEQIRSLPEIDMPHPGVYVAHGSFLVQENHKIVTEYLKPSKPYLFRKSWWALRSALHQEENPPELLRHGWVDPVLMISGHTHEQAFVELGDQCEVCSPPAVGQEYYFTNDPERPVYINPGSVGFSRHNGGKLACYAIVDLDPPGKVLYYQVPYNRQRTCRLLRQLYPEDEFRILRESLGCDELAGK